MTHIEAMLLELAIGPRARMLARQGLALVAATAAGCGSVSSRTNPDAGSAIDAGLDTMPAPLLKLEGCPIVKTSRPASTSTAEAPLLGKLTVGAAVTGQPLPGTLKLPAQSTATTLLVQVDGQAEHMACALSPGERSAKQIDLSRIGVAASSGPGNYRVYFGLADASGNVGGYAVATVSLGAVAPIAICGGPPFQALGRSFSTSTATYTANNGPLPDYVVSGTPTEPLSVITQSRLYVNTGGCAHLWVASEPTGTKAVGWDNFLLVEYRSAPGAAVGKAWFYGSPGSTIVGASPSQTVVHEIDPTVAGTSLDPQVPSGAPFGYPAKAIDLLTQVPATSHSFELTLYILDFRDAGVGSTTDVWLLPQ